MARRKPAEGGPRRLVLGQGLCELVPGRHRPRLLVELELDRKAIAVGDSRGLTDLPVEAEIVDAAVAREPGPERVAVDRCSHGSAKAPERFAGVERQDNGVAA